jgi:hypothetical protein
MKIVIEGIACSMGCVYAEGPVSLCECSCGGKTHGQFSENTVRAVRCSPAAERRCKEGNETGACQCACNGTNHGIYQLIPDFASVKITHYAA